MHYCSEFVYVRGRIFVTIYPMDPIECLSKDLSKDNPEDGETLELQPRPHCIVKNMDFETKYELLDELGKGMFGVVKKCQNKETGEHFAAKIVRKTTKSKKEVSREIAMMNQLHHKKLAQIYDAFETSRQMIIVMEYIPGEELFEKIIQDDRCLTELQVMRYMKQILFGVEHMHKKCIVHLDLKPENILCIHGGVPGYEEIKLIDFGLAREIKPGSEETAICGTPEFVAPEVISFDPISMSSDMWSLGVITYVLLSGISPFLGDNDSETLQNVTAGEYEFDEEDDEFTNISDAAKMFIKKLLQLNPRKRMTVEDCLKHDWLTHCDEQKEHILDTTNLRNYLTRRKWKKTINAIKAVGRFSLGLSLFKNKAKNSTENTADQLTEKTTIIQEDKSDNVLANATVFTKQLKHSTKENIITPSSSSADEGISDEDVENHDVKDVEENLENTPNTAEDSGCFDNMDLNNNTVVEKEKENEEEVFLSNHPITTVEDDLFIENNQTQSTTQSSIKKTINSDFKLQSGLLDKENIKNGISVCEENDEDVTVILTNERENRRASRAEQRRIICANSDKNKEEKESIEQIKIDYGKISNGDNKEQQLSEEIEIDKNFLKEKEEQLPKNKDNIIKTAIRTSEVRKPSIVEQRKMSLQKNNKTSKDNSSSKHKIQRTEHKIAQEESSKISSEIGNRTKNISSFKRSNREKAENNEAMEESTEKKNGSSETEKRRISFNQECVEVTPKNKKESVNQNFNDVTNTQNSQITEKRKDSLFSKFNKIHSKSISPDLKYFDRLVGSPILNKRSSNNVRPSQMRRAKTHDEIMLPPKEKNQPVTTNHNEKKPLNLRRSIGANPVQTNLRKFSVNITENHNKHSDLRKKSVPFNVMRKTSVRDRMALFQSS